jgi:hypothetical protein
MKFMTTWSAQPGTLSEAVGRFLAGQGLPAEGVTLLGRWHNVGCNGGYTLYESNNPAAVYESAAVWADLLDINTELVIEDDAAGPILAKVFKK